MIEAWVTELGRAFITLAFQPLLLWLFILTALASYFRRKVERKNFGTSIYPSGAEWKNTWLISLISSLLLSILMVGIGGSLYFSVLIVISIITIILTITGSFVLLSSAYILGLSLLVIFLAPKVNIPIIQESWILEWQDTSLTLLLCLVVVFLILEAILGLSTKRQNGFPRLIKGNRGKYVGIHILKRMMVVPFFLPIPTGSIEAFAPWWPVFPINDISGYSLTIFPMIIGLQQAFQGAFIDRGGKTIGKWLFLVAFIVALFAAGSFIYPILAVIGAAIAIIGRLALQLAVRFTDQEKQPIFTPQANGLVILSVIPKTAADKMGLKIGEKIEKVHQIEVTNEQEFYDALQENRTFCKLEVRTLEGELRFVQSPLYEDDHYELGLVFVKEKPRFRLYHDISTLLLKKGQ